MSHSHKRSSWQKEGMFTLITGFLYGATNTMVGHPFDTIKTKMQAQMEFFDHGGYVETVKSVYQKEGPIGFYRGCFPPFFGSILYRSSQFAILDVIYTKYQHDAYMTQKIPFTAGLEPRVIAGGLVAGVARSIMECPFEYAKVKRQTGQTWEFSHIYKGFVIVNIRNAGLLTSFFIFLDYYRRNTKLFETKLGQFIASGTSACLSFWLIWPLEFLKNQIQAENAQFGTTVRERVRNIIQKHGTMGMYRGIFAGSQSIFFRNGASMIVMQAAQKKLTEWGFRD